MEKDITRFKEVLELAKKISSHDNFDYYVNTRECEQEIAKFEGQIDFNDTLNKEITDFIDNNLSNDRPTAYVLFLLLFTTFRRKKYGNLERFVYKYIINFKQYAFSEFVELLMLYNVKKDDEHLHELLIRCKRLTESKGVYHDFTSHKGIINLYVEVVCAYFELNLDARYNEKVNKYIVDAIEKIDYIIASSNGEVYSKFYLNKGRLEVLQGNYQLGEEYIVKGIQTIGYSNKRFYTVAEYEQFLNKLEMIKLYDLNNKKIKEIEKTKVDNIKSLSMMTALLSFILGTINIFSKVEDLKTLALLMVTYAGLIMILLATLLFGVKLLYNDKNKKFGIYNILLFIFGIIIFGVSIVLILI